MFIAGADVPVADSDTAPQNCSDGGHISERLKKIHYFLLLAGADGQQSVYARRLRARKKTPAPVL